MDSTIANGRAKPADKAGWWSEARLRLAATWLYWGAASIGRLPPVRQAIIGTVDRRLRTLYARGMSSRPDTAELQQHRRDMVLAILHTMERGVAEGLVSASTLRGALNIIARQILTPGDVPTKRAFEARQGTLAPGFLAISPGKACNLRCVGCYADAGPVPEALPWETLNRLVREAVDLWGVRFFVLSGGEPLVYRHSDLGVLDLAENNPDCFFMMYTNGTLIDEPAVRRLARAGNLTPAISIEGLRERTDARRGAGVFDRVLEAMARLHSAHVPFGISITATRENAEEVVSDEVLDFYFQRLGAMYGWLFHYMPMGRAVNLERMPTARQRVAMMERMWQVIRQKQYFLADFWNSGLLSDGCVSAGRGGGYLHVDWNGAVSPCIFVPYTPVNIHDVYARGGTIEDAWADPFFAALRNWQQAYNPGLGAPAGHPNGNLLMPCPIRDHHADFRRLLASYKPEPADESARASLSDSAYHEGLEQFDRELAELADPLWRERYGQTSEPEDTRTM
jgi:MoaA/NifB/PqqE/SkfB family radical SAM enzyme